MTLPWIKSTQVEPSRGNFLFSGICMFSFAEASSFNCFENVGRLHGDRSWCSYQYITKLMAFSGIGRIIGSERFMNRGGCDQIGHGPVFCSE